MLLTDWSTWLVVLLALVFPRNPETNAQLEWPRIQDMVASRLARDPMVWTLQEGFSSRIGVDKSQERQPENSVSGQDTSEDIQREAEGTGRSLSAQPTEDTERSPDAQARFMGKFDEWYKGKGNDEEEEKPPQIIISTHHGVSSHDLDHHHVDHHSHHEHHDHSHSYHGPPHAHPPPFPHHAPPPPVYHYPHHHQQPVVQPIIIESGRGHGGGGNKKKKGSKGNAVVSVYTETVVVTKPKPVVLTQTVTHHHQTQPHPVYVPTSKPVYVTPSQVFIQSSNAVYSTPSHIYISSSTPIYATPSHIYIQTPAHTQYLTPSHVFIQEPQTEYVAVSIETEDHGWGWGWDLFGGNGKGSSGHGGGQVQVIGDGHYHHHHHGSDKGKGQVVYVMEKPEVAPQLVTTHVVVQQQIPLMTHLAHPSTSEVMIMERPSHAIKKGFDRVRETFKAFGDGIKGVGDKIAEGVHHIKSKFSFQSKDSEEPHYVMLQPQNTHSVLVVTTAVPQTVVIQKPITQTVKPKPVIQTVAAYQPMVSNKGGTYFKGNFKGYSYGKSKSKGGDAVIIVSGDGHGHGHHQSHGSECLHCG
ncbi:uncharacterized protein [Macrobrachium rosenbergii]|uniref:uncharacterized protein isoform X2 n=1 Tax=Macrobrachium rosenbergii TaxID=79674 RepID=UPI0034D5AF77